MNFIYIILISNSTSGHYTVYIVREGYINSNDRYVIVEYSGIGEL